MEPVRLTYPVEGGDFIQAGEASSKMKMTLKKLGLPTHIQIAEADCQMINDHAFLRNSVALAEQVTTIGKNALLNKLGSLTSTAKQREVEQAIAVFFNMGTADTTTKKEARTW